MVSHHVFYQLVLIILVWVFLMLYGLWPSESAATRLTIPQPNTPPRKRSRGFCRKFCSGGHAGAVAPVCGGD
jgi:hypothetical protein